MQWLWIFPERRPAEFERCLARSKLPIEGKHRIGFPMNGSGSEGRAEWHAPVSPVLDEALLSRAEASCQSDEPYGKWDQA
jgi:hypothetical protein